MKTKGFTLIELLVTMGIIAVLTGMAVFNFNQARVRARDVQRKSDVGQLGKALELYKNDNGIYYQPKAVTDPDLQTKLLSLGYTKTTFNDPRGTDWGIYKYLSNDGLTYYLMTCLENAADNTRTLESSGWCDLFPNGLAAGQRCKCGGVDPASYTGTMYIISNP